MTEETTSVEPEVQNEAPSKPTSSEPPKVVKEAEHKLKEMSKKAKERKTAQNASKHPKGLSEINYFWLVIGGLAALGVGYLVFGKKDPDRREPPKQRPRFKFLPRRQPEASRPKTPEKVPVNEDVEKEEKSVPKFELNCF